MSHDRYLDAPTRGRGLGMTVWLWPAALPVLLLIYWLTSSVVMLLFFDALPMASIIAYIAISGSVLAGNPSDYWLHTDRNQVDP